MTERLLIPRGYRLVATWSAGELWYSDKRSHWRVRVPPAFYLSSALQVRQAMDRLRRYRKSGVGAWPKTEYRSDAFAIVADAYGRRVEPSHAYRTVPVEVLP